MKRYIFKRLPVLLLMIWLASTLVFFLIRAIPGDPVRGILGEKYSSETAFYPELGQGGKDTFPGSYLHFQIRLLHLDLGTSFATGEPVMAEMAKYFPNTIYLALSALIIALVIAIPTGALCAFKEDTLFDNAVTLLSSLGVSIPGFFLGALLMIFFAGYLRLLPVSGSGTWKHLVLPALTLGLIMSAILTRIIRGAISEELKKRYILLARAKGLKPSAIFFRHLLKNAMIPVVTTVGLQLSALLSGCLIVETVFSWQGVGLLFIDSVQKRDYPMMQGLLLLMVVIYLSVNFLVDISYFLLDPTVQNESS